MNTIGKGKVQAFLWMFVFLSLFFTTPYVFAQTSIVGTWGQIVLGHASPGSSWYTWKTETGRITFNADGTGSMQYKESADICPDENYCKPLDGGPFTYTATTNQDGSILLTLNGSQNYRIVPSDNGKMYIMDGTSTEAGSQMFIVGVRIDTSHSYSTADANGPYFTGGYEHDAYPVSEEKYNKLYSAISTMDGTGGFSMTGKYNGDGTIVDITPPYSGTYSIAPDGSMQIGGQNGSSTGDGKVAVFSTAQGGVATDFASFIALKKADRQYSPADLQGTWAYAGFGDYQGTTFRSEFGTVTCDQNSSCTISMKRKISDGTTSNFSTSINLTASSDGALNGFLLTDAKPHFSGAIGNNGNTMILVMNTSDHDTNDRALGVAVKCSTCSNLAGAPTISFTGKVVDANRNPLSGATITVVGNPSAPSTTSDASGSFTLTGLPSGTDFWLKINKTGYLDRYTQNFKSTANIDTTVGSVILYTGNDISSFYASAGITPDSTKGVIMGWVYAAMSPSIGYVNGVAITATSGSTSGKTYPVLYFNDSGPAGNISSTTTNGRFIVLNVDNGDTVTITGTKTNWTVSQTVYRTFANSVSSGRSTGSTSSTISFTGTVFDGSSPSNAPLPLSGVNVRLYGNSSITVTSGTNGNFTLPGLPPDTTFELMFTLGGYIPTYTSNMSFTSNYTNPRTYALWTQQTITNWGVTSGKGVIYGRVMNDANPSTGYLSGAMVTYTSGKHPGTQPYVVKYRDDAGALVDGPSTYSDGRYYILNVEEDDTVKVTATKSGYDFTQKNPKTFVTHGNAVSLATLYGIQIGGPDITSISLSQGWNFVSFPKLPSNTTIGTVLADVSSSVRIVWGYNNQSKVWLKYKPNTQNSTLNTLDIVETGKGYWIYMNAPGSITMTNWTAPSTTVQLYEGWDLIGYNGTDNAPVTDALKTISGKWAIIWNWTDGQWYAKHSDPNITLPVPTPSTLNQGKAYWIKIKPGIGSESSPLDDIALNTAGSGYPSPLESDSGWGGGAHPWEIVDGKRTYPGEWARGLAFTGGTGNWAGQACGWRQATIDFGEPKTFNKVVVWHQVIEHVPNTYKIQYWDGTNWVDVFSTTNGHAYLKYPSEGSSTPTENTFTSVTSQKVRFTLNNCDITHGWIYEFEVYNDTVRQL